MDDGYGRYEMAQWKNSAAQNEKGVEKLKTKQIASQHKDKFKQAANKYFSGARLPLIFQPGDESRGRRKKRSLRDNTSS